MMPILLNVFCDVTGRKNESTEIAVKAFKATKGVLPVIIQLRSRIRRPY